MMWAALHAGYQMRPESIRGALAYITAILHVPILPEPRTGRFGAPDLCGSQTVPGGVCGSRPCGRTARGFAVGAANADCVVPARHRLIVVSSLTVTDILWYNRHHDLGDH